MKTEYEQFADSFRGDRVYVRRELDQRLARLRERLVRLEENEEIIHFAGKKVIYVPKPVELPFAYRALDFAVAATGRPHPHTLPPIRMMALKRLTTLVHGAFAAMIGIQCHGVYWSCPVDEVWIADADGADSLVTQSVLVHELTHFLQSFNEPNHLKSAEEVWESEIEAFNAQYSFCLQHGCPMTPPCIVSRDDIVPFVKANYREQQNYA